MKKTFVLFILILVSSCSVDWNDENVQEVKELNKEVIELNNDISELNTKYEDETFNKKLECGKLIDKEKEWLSDFVSMDYNSAGRLVNKEGEMGIEKSRSEVLETFYSNKKSSCISVIQVAYNIDMSWSYRYLIRDVFENKTLGDYFNDDYYSSIINQYGNGKYNWDDVNYPRACSEDSRIDHCIEYFRYLDELKGS